MSDYKVNSGADIALVAATPAWAFVFDAAAGAVIKIPALRVSTKSADGSHGPILIEVIRCTAHAGSGGTNVTPVAVDPAVTVAARLATCKRAVTTGSITAAEVLEERLEPVQGEVELIPLKPYTFKSGDLGIIRLTAPNDQNARVSFDLSD